MPEGVLLSVIGKDYFVSFNRLPWLKSAKVTDVLNVSMLGKMAIKWDNLDVDLEIKSLEYPEKYPLVMKRYAEEVL
ncbi:hypothetical protein AGMMS4956_20940 [Bacteroidia bacterium]|nr:hypothetical protein AGMMS4956_20940 [Bacteroidia bacterium]